MTKTKKYREYRDTRYQVFSNPRPMSYEFNFFWYVLGASGRITQKGHEETETTADAEARSYIDWHLDSAE